MKFFYYEQLIKYNLLSKYYCNNTIVEINISNDMESQILSQPNKCIRQLIIYGDDNHMSILNLENLPNLTSLYINNCNIDNIINVKKLQILKTISSVIKYLPINLPLKYFCINSIEFTNLYKYLTTQKNWQDMYAMFKHDNKNIITHLMYEHKILNSV